MFGFLFKSKHKYHEIEVIKPSIANNEASQHGIVFNYLKTSKKSRNDSAFLSLKIDASSCVGLICSNSKIRSSIFRMIVGEKYITTGDIFINGKSVKTSSEEALQDVGYCSNECSLFRHMTGRENLKVLGLIKGIPRDILEEKMKKLSEELGFSDFLDKLVKGYNEENRKCLGLAVALIDDPKILILEEPTRHLDAVTTQQIFKPIKRLKNEGTTILILSENPSSVESICDKFAIVVNSELKLFDAPENLKNDLAQGINIVIEFNHEEPENARICKSIEIKNFIKTYFPESEISER